jgi:hypothetical protein
MKRFLIIALAVLLGLVATALIGGPYFAKNYIEKNSVELVGRKIEMDRLHFNAFNGHVLITNFQLFEPDDATRFVQFDTLYINMALYKLLGGHVWSDALHLKGLDVSIWKRDSLFNFTDLMMRSDTLLSDSASTEQENSFIDQFTFNDIQILNSSIFFEDKILNTQHDMQEINVRLPGITIGDEQTTAGLEFSFANGGDFRINLEYDLVENGYVLDLEIDQLNLNPFTRYAQESLNIADLQGWFSSNLLILGDLDEPTTPLISGSMNLNDFSLTDLNRVEAVGLSSLFMDAKEINLVTGNYHFGKLSINQPFVSAVIAEEGDNIRGLLKEVEERADTIIEAERELIEENKLSYLLEEFRLNDGKIEIVDRTLQSREFDYRISQLNFAADSIAEGTMVTFDMDALMNGKGTLTGHVVTDPGDPGNGTFDFALKNTDITDFSAYSEDATGFPVTSGLMSFQTENKIVNNHLNSHIVINMFDTELGDKRKDIEPEINVPLKLGLVVLEDTKGRINIDVPAEGDIDDPEFRYSKLVWKVVLNVLVKAAASPYTLLAKGLGVDEDQLAFIRMEMLQEELGPEQTAQLDLLRKLLNDKPQLNIVATLNIHEDAEGDAIRDYIARKGFYLQQEYGNDKARVTISAVDKVKIMEIEEDKAFDAFLSSKVKVSTDSLSRQELIASYASEQAVKAEQQRLNDARKAAINAYLLAHPEVASRITVAEEISAESNKKRPRFLLTYQLAETAD